MARSIGRPREGEDNLKTFGIRLPEETIQTVKNLNLSREIRDFTINLAQRRAQMSEIGKAGAEETTQLEDFHQAAIAIEGATVGVDFSIEVQAELSGLADKQLGKEIERGTPEEQRLVRTLVYDEETVTLFVPTAKWLKWNGWGKDMAFLILTDSSTGNLDDVYSVSPAHLAVEFFESEAWME